MTDTPTPQPCCAHLHVKYVTADHPDGGTRGWWECEDCKHPFAPVPRQTAEGGGKDAHEHRFDSLRIHDDDGRIFHVCLECGAREYETTDEGGKDA
jgi:hypothetical protein